MIVNMFLSIIAVQFSEAFLTAFALLASLTRRSFSFSICFNLFASSRSRRLVKLTAVFLLSLFFGDCLSRGDTVGFRGELRSRLDDADEVKVVVVVDVDALGVKGSGDGVGEGGIRGGDCDRGRDMIGGDGDCNMRAGDGDLDMIGGDGDRGMIGGDGDCDIRGGESLGECGCDLVGEFVLTMKESLPSVRSMIDISFLISRLGRFTLISPITRTDVLASNMFGSSSSSDISM